MIKRLLRIELALVNAFRCSLIILPLLPLMCQPTVYCFHYILKVFSVNVTLMHKSSASTTLLLLRYSLVRLPIINNMLLNMFARHQCRTIAWLWVFRVEPCLRQCHGFLGPNPASGCAVGFQSRILRLVVSWVFRVDSCVWLCCGFLGNCILL